MQFYSISRCEIGIGFRANGFPDFVVQIVGRRPLDSVVKHHAEHIVEDLSGVKHVQNNLRVQELSPSRGASTTQAMPMGENSKLSDQAAGKA